METGNDFFTFSFNDQQLESITRNNISQFTKFEVLSLYSKHPHKRTSGLRTSGLKFVILDTCYIRTLQ